MALRPDQTTPPQSPKTPRQPGSWLRLALLAGLSLYIVILLSPVLSRFGGPARVDLSYSQLLTQIDNGNVAADQLQVLLGGAGECLIDNVQVITPTSANLITNSTFETDASSWTAEGAESASSLETSEGF